MSQGKFKRFLKKFLKEDEYPSGQTLNSPKMSSAPLFKLVIPLMAGILLQTNHLLPLNFFWFILGISFLLLFLFTFGKINLRFPQFGKSYPLFLILCLCSLSALYTHYKDDRRASDYFSQYVASENILEVSIDEMPIESENSVKSIVRVLKVKDSLGWHKASGLALCYFAKDDSALCLNYGDKLLIQTSLKEIRVPQNPYEFDYKNYLANKHIFYHSYIRKGDWFSIEKGKTNGMFALALSLRKNFIDQLKSSGLTKNESAISSGILLGWDHEIDPATLHEFSSAGITHLLCVSGLHVGIISLLAGYLLFFLNKTRRHRRIKGFMQILVLFLFAFITGLSPSVMRASFMFSFIILGQIFSRTPNVYNSLGAAALILLLIDPLFLLHVGFQLSFMAVLGIVAIQPILFNWVKTLYKPLNKIFELAAVSTAVQIATLPFILYYFHQFPIYFLIANVIIVPLVGILLGNILLVVFLSWIPWLGNFFVWLLSLEIKGINWIVQHVEALPYSLAVNIPFSFAEAFILAAMIFFGVMVFLERKRAYAFAFLSLTVIFLSVSLIEIYKAENQQNTTIYSLGKKTFAIEFTQGNESFIVGNDLFIENPEKSEFQILNNHIQTRQRNIEYILLNDTCSHKKDRFFKKGDIIQFGDEKYFFLHAKNNYSKTKCPIELDYLVLLENPKVSISELQDFFSFKTLIISYANSERRILNWEEDCGKLNQPYFSVAQQGAFLRN